jgi:hypothetical protein
MEAQKPQNSKSNPEQKDQCRGITIPGFKLYHRTTLTKTAWYWGEKPDWLTVRID